MISASIRSTYSFSLRAVSKPSLPFPLNMFVNDAVLAVPGLYGYFYDNNASTAEAMITR